MPAQELRSPYPPHRRSYMPEEENAPVSNIPVNSYIVVIKKMPDQAQVSPSPAPTVATSGGEPESTPPVTEAYSVKFSSLVAAVGGAVTSLFVDPESAQPINAKAAEGLNLENYFQVSASPEALAGLLTQLQNSPDVASAYIVQAPPPMLSLLTAQPCAPAPAAATPDFSAQENHLDAAPAGLDVRFAWTKTGGDGTGVQIIDIEGGWRTTHEDLQVNIGGVVLGTSATDAGSSNHGTAVLGVIGATDNATGVKGISTGANVRMVSFFSVSAGIPFSTSTAIQRAADLLKEGDVLLLEMQDFGPSNNFLSNPQELGYIPVEWRDDVFKAIRYAANLGIIVVEAAANGAENLDAPIYNTAPAGSPPDWAHAFARGGRDSGAILVGAGSPPPPTRTAAPG